MNLVIGVEMPESTEVILAKLDGKLDNLLERCDTVHEILTGHVEEDKSQFDKIDLLLRGKDRENPGVVSRLERCEGQQNRDEKSKWWWRGIGATVIGGLVVAVIIKVL